MNDRKVCARSNSYMTFLEITIRVGSQDRKSGFLRGEMYALLNTCRSVKSIRSGYECRARNTQIAYNKNPRD